MFVHRKTLIPVRRKVDARIKRRERKALVAAQIENVIEKKLLARLKEGTVSQYNIYIECKKNSEKYQLLLFFIVLHVKVMACDRGINDMGKKLLDG